MKKLFFKSIALFALLIFLIMVFNITVNTIISNNVDFSINDRTKYVVFGHSHSESAINDSLVSNLENLSKSGESYYYMYPKVKNVINQNPNIEYVLIDFSNNQIDSAMDDWIWGDNYLSNRYLTYAPFISNTAQLTILKNNFFGFLEFFPVSLKRNFKRVIDNEYYFSKFEKLGGYNYLVRYKTDSLINAVGNKTYKPNLNNEISNSNIEYLEKIISFCEANNKKVILFRSPQHKLNPELRNEIKFKEILQTKFSNLDFLDFNDFPLDNIEFGDFGHLNFRGAKIFSLWLDLRIKEALLEKSNKTELIKNQINQFGFEDRTYLMYYYDQKLVENKKLLMNNILSKGNSFDTKHKFLEGFKSNKLFFYSDNNFRYMAIEFSGDNPIELLQDKSFGIHGIIYDKDFDLLPIWVKAKNVNRLTWKSDFEIYNIEDKIYIFLTLKKDCEIEDFKQLRIFLMDRVEYKGTIGKPMEIEHYSFKKGFLNKNENSIKEVTSKMEKLLTNAIHNSLSLQEQHVFAEELKSLALIPFSDESNQYIAIEYTNEYPEEFLKDKAFGIQALAYDKDFDLLPDWVKQKDGAKFLTWKSDPEKESFNGKYYIILTLDKKCKIDKWEQLRIFLINRDEYKGTIGQPLEINNVEFKG